MNKQDKEDIINCIIWYLSLLTFGIIHNRKCNLCHQKTPKEKRVPDINSDFQCIACATDSGLFKEVQENEFRQKQRLNRRKQFGL